MSNVNVLVGGDVCPIDRNEPCFMNGDPISIWHDLLPEFRQADYVIVNLECPLIDMQNPIMKTGPVLGVDTSCINGFKSAKINMVALANNHIMDNGLSGLNSTLAACKAAGIRVVGAGKNLEDAKKIVVEVVEGIRIGVLSAAEHEFSIAESNYGGANPLNLAEYVRILRNCHENFDYLIVLVHGGNENYPYPSPRLMDTCRFMIEEGANAVICQHSHCAGCYEEYLGGHIVYGQGNLVFYYPNLSQFWYDGFLVKLSINPDFSSTMSLIPITQTLETPGASKMSSERKELFLSEIEARSVSIKDPKFVDNKWMDFCAERKDQYLGLMLGTLPFLKMLNLRNYLVKYVCSKKSIIYMLNVIRCESHRDVLITLLDQYTKKNQ